MSKSENISSTSFGLYGKLDVQISDLGKTFRLRSFAWCDHGFSWKPFCTPQRSAAAGAPCRSQFTLLAKRQVRLGQHDWLHQGWNLIPEALVVAVVILYRNHAEWIRFGLTLDVFG